MGVTVEDFSQHIQSYNPQFRKFTINTTIIYTEVFFLFHVIKSTMTYSSYENRSKGSMLYIKRLKDTLNLLGRKVIPFSIDNLCNAAIS